MYCIQFLGVVPVVQYVIMVSGAGTPTNKYNFEFQFEECNRW